MSAAKKPKQNRTTTGDRRAGAALRSEGGGLDPAWAKKTGLAFATLILLRTIASFFPAERLWGLNHSAYLPDWTTWLFAATGLALCTPLLYRLFMRMGEGLFAAGDASPRSLKPWAAAIAAGVVFWLFRMDTYFLGDGAVYLAEIYRFVRGIPGSESVLYSRGSAPGTGWLLAHTAKLAFNAAASAESILANPQFAFWLLAALFGAGYIAFSVHAAARLGERSDERFAFLILLITVPGVLFYFGYVEYYTFFYTTFAAYLYLGMRSLSGRSVAAPVIALIAASAFHFMAVVAIPGLLFLMLARSANPKVTALLRPKYALLAIAFSLLAGGIYYFASGIHVHGSRTVLSLYPFGREGAIQSYTLLSSWHLIDFVNYVFLLSAPVLIGMVFTAEREAFRRPEVMFAALNAAFFTFLAFFGNMGFGMARDWDINAGLGMALLFLFIALVRASAPSRKKSFVLYATAGASLAAVLPWLAVNLNPASAVERAEAILALDDRHVAGDYALNGYEHLRKYFDSRGDAEGVTWAIRKKIEVVGYPEDFRKLALRAITDVATDRKRAEYEWLFDRLYDKIKAMNVSGRDTVYAGTKTEFLEIAAESILQCLSLPSQWGFDDAFVEEQKRRFADLEPGAPSLRLLRAQLELTRPGAVPDREAFLEGAAALRSSPTLAAYAGMALLELSEYEAARKAFELATALDTAFTLPLLYLAEAELELGADYARSAEAHLERFLATPDGWRVFGAAEQRETLARRARTLLEKLRNTERSNPASP